jgi:hypothetical protein
MVSFFWLYQAGQYFPSLLLGIALLDRFSVFFGEINRLYLDKIDRRRHRREKISGRGLPKKATKKEN